MTINSDIWHSVAHGGEGDYDIFHDFISVADHMGKTPGIEIGDTIIRIASYALKAYADEAALLGYSAVIEFCSSASKDQKEGIACDW